MKETSYYKLQKPDYSDLVEVSVINKNMDVLDGEIKRLQRDIGRYQVEYGFSYSEYNKINYDMTTNKISVEDDEDEGYMIRKIKTGHLEKINNIKITGHNIQTNSRARVEVNKVVKRGTWKSIIYNGDPNITNGNLYTIDKYPVVLGDKIYVLDNDDSSPSYMHIFDFKTGTGKGSGPLNSKYKKWKSPVVVGKYIIGQSINVGNDLMIYDIDTGNWSYKSCDMGPSLLSECWDYAVAIGSKIYAMYGKGIWEYDVNNNSSKKITSRKESMSYPIAVGKKIYVAVTETGKFNSKVLVYDTDKGTWGTTSLVLGIYTSWGIKVSVGSKIHIRYKQNEILTYDTLTDKVESNTLRGCGLDRMSFIYNYNDGNKFTNDNNIYAIGKMGGSTVLKSCDITDESVNVKSEYLSNGVNYVELHDIDLSDCNKIETKFSLSGNAELSNASWTWMGEKLVTEIRKDMLHVAEEMHEHVVEVSL
ncbi:hypothetical protein PV797_05470 [Clostridiaceae bacterium M8S5]|nr:hypothetical protein PV797_05470 [Clostridiaceae bacterium M8S5]